MPQAFHHTRAFVEMKNLFFQSPPSFLNFGRDTSSAAVASVPASVLALRYKDEACRQCTSIPSTHQASLVRLHALEQIGGGYCVLDPLYEPHAVHVCAYKQVVGDLLKESAALLPQDVLFLASSSFSNSALAHNRTVSTCDMNEEDVHYNTRSDNHAFGRCIYSYIPYSV